MVRTLLLTLTVSLAASTAAAESAAPMPEVPADEQAALDQGAKYLREQSYTRACNTLDAYVRKFGSGVLIREGKVKRAIACAQSGGETSEVLNDLRAIADGGPIDLARALANARLVERGDYGRAKKALDLLESVAAKSGGRWAQEARSRFMSLAFLQMENGYGEVPAVADRVLGFGPTPAEKDRALFVRGRWYLNQGNDKGEKDLKAVADGNGELFDDALYELAQARERKAKWEEALGIYQDLVKRANPSTTNRRGDAESRIGWIKQPEISVSSDYVEWPGEKTRLNLSFRNLPEAKFTLYKADPYHADPTKLIYGNEEDRAGLRPAQPFKTWTETFKAPAPYVGGSKELVLDLPAGSYSLDVHGQNLHRVTNILVTSFATLVKIGGGRAAVWTVDATTGMAIAGADVALYVRQDRNTSDYRRLEGKADATGLCLFDLGPGGVGQAIAWAGKGDLVATATGYGSWRDPGSSELLSYTLTDRPLYKPGEKVGIKVFVRERKAGPAEAAPNIGFEARIYDASGRELDKKSLTTNAFGTAAYDFPLPKDAQLGQYSVQLSFPNHNVRTDYGRFRVEEYKPPEYTVKVEPLGKPKPGEVAKVKVSASFFFGGPVANAQGRAIVSLNYWQHGWAPWPDVQLEDGWSPYGGYGYGSYGGYDDEMHYYRGRRYNPYGYAVAPAKTLTFKTDAAGSATLEVPTDDAQKYFGTGVTDYSYSVQVFVTDASRREVTGQGKVNVSKSPFFLDLRADRLLYKPGERIKVELRAEDANSNPESPAVEVRLVRLDPSGSGQAGSEILKKPAQLTGGKGAIELDADALGPVRVEARMAQTDTVLASTDVWLTNEAKPIIPPQAGFLFLTDRTPLKVGGTVRGLIVTPSQEGHALVTIEGDRLWAARSLEVRGRARFVELPLTGEMAPNVILHASRIENAQYYEAQAPLIVSGSEAALDVTVGLPGGKTEPGAAVPISIALNAKGAQQAPVELAVTMVDEAIYQIEQPRNDFLSYFARRAQQQMVNTNNSLYNKAFRPKPVRQQQADKDRAQAAPQKPAENAKLDSLASNFAGGKGMAAPAPSVAPAAKAASAPAMEASADMAEEKAPARAKKEAAGPADGEAGSGAAQKPVKARTNFSSSAGWFPQVKGAIGDKASLKTTMPDSLTSWRLTAVAVTAGPHMGMGKATLRTEKPLMVRLQGPRFFTERDEVTLSAIVTSRLDKAADVDVVFECPGLKPLDPPTKKVQVAPGGEARVDVRYLVENPGDRKVKVTARGAGEADAMEWTLPAVVHGSAQRATFTGQLRDQLSFKVSLPEKRNPMGTRLELSLSPSVLGVMLDALPYLAQYPYGCVEQTLSRFVPAAIAAKIVNKVGVTTPRVPADLNDMVDAGLKRLYSFQHGDGGWGWWQTDATNRWMSAYAVYGLWLGKEAGLKVDETVLRRGREYLTSHLGAAMDRSDEHAFMIFSLAMTGGAPKFPLTKAFENRKNLSSRGRALIALALLAQNDPRARIAVENLDDIVKVAAARGDASVGEANSAWETSAAIEATAYTLMAYHRYNPADPMVQKLTDFLVLRRNGNKWRSTRDSAFALYALADIALKEDATRSTGTITVLVNGAEAARLNYKGGGADLPGALVVGDDKFKVGENTVEVRRDGKGTGYWAATWDVYNQDENVKGVGGDVKITRRYTILGRPGAQKAQADMEYGMALDSGERVRVDVDVTANKAVEFVMIEDLKPAGMEAVLQKSGPEVCNYACAHAELRTDRVAMFLTELRVGTVHLSYELRAEVPGKFHGLPARFEAMYAPEIKATSDEIRLEIRDAPEPGDKGVAAQ
ncbi:MAG: MG2 domain-containing protein [Myxococcales bacterium]